MVLSSFSTASQIFSIGTWGLTEIAQTVRLETNVWKVTLAEGEKNLTGSLQCAQNLPVVYLYYQTQNFLLLQPLYKYSDQKIYPDDADIWLQSAL